MLNETIAFVYRASVCISRLVLDGHYGVPAGRECGMSCRPNAAYE